MKKITSVVENKMYVKSSEKKSIRSALSEGTKNKI